MVEVKNIGGYEALIFFDKSENQYTIAYKGKGGAIISGPDQEETERKFVEAMQVAEVAADLNRMTIEKVDDYSVTTSKGKIYILKNGEVEDEYLITEVLAAVPIGNKTQLHYVRDGIQSSKIYNSEDIFNQIIKLDVT